MHDRHSGGSFAEQARGVLAVNSEVVLASMAYVLCQPTAPTTKYLYSILSMIPGVRGWRGAAITAMFSQKFVLDDTRPRRSGAAPAAVDAPVDAGQAHSFGGAVKAIKPGKGDEPAVVSFEKVTVKQENWVKEHYTNRIVGIVGSTIMYEVICDKTAIQDMDQTYPDNKVTAATAKFAKPGVVISQVTGDGDTAAIIAVWPSKSAKVPSVVLGGAVK